MTVDPKFTLEIRGKAFVLVAGLLDLCHQAGLCGTTSEVCRELCDPQKQFWVVRVTGRFRDADGQIREYSAYGDASPDSSQMRGAYLRHAETRGFARMARIAVNVSMCSVEELGDEDETLGANRSALWAKMVSHQPAERETAAEGGGLAVRHGPVCEECSAPLPAPIYRASMKEFEKPLCVEHGKARRKQQKENLYQEQEQRLAAERTMGVPA